MVSFDWFPAWAPSIPGSLHSTRRKYLSEGSRIIPALIDGSALLVAKEVVSSSGDSAGLDLVSPCAVADVKDSVSKNISTSEEFENKQVFENVTETKVAPSDDFTFLDCSYTFTWLDYFDPGAVSDIHNVASQNKDVSVIQDSRNQEYVQNDVLLQNASEFSSRVYPHKGEPNLKIDSCSTNS